MKKFFVFALLFTASLVHAQTAALPIYACVLPGTQALVSGLKSSNYQYGIIPSCTVTVYLSGTTTIATTSPMTPRTANLDGSIPPIYAATGVAYDVKLSGGGGNANCTTAPNCYTTPVTLTGVIVGGGGGDMVTSPNSTLNVGGSSTNTTLDINLAKTNTWTGIQTFQQYVAITQTSGSQFLLMGNQDSTGANNPAMLRAVNGNFCFGHGSSWSGSGGTFTCNVYMTNSGGVSLGTDAASSTDPGAGNVLSSGYADFAGGYKVGGSPFGTVNLSHWTDAGIANGNCPVWNSSTSKWTPGSCGSVYTLPIASFSTLGGVKPDGTSCTVNATTGILTCEGSGGGYPGVTTDGSDGLLVAGAVSPGTSPYCDIRSMGYVPGVSSSIDPYFQACLNTLDSAPAGAAGLIRVEGGHWNYPLPCQGANCTLSTPIGYSASQPFNVLLDGTFYINSTMAFGNGVSRISGAPGIQGGQFQRAWGPLIGGPPAKGTLGTAITTTNAAVTMALTYSDGSIANLPPGAAITIAANATVTGVTATRAGSIYGAGLATLTFPGAQRVPWYGANCKWLF